MSACVTFRNLCHVWWLNLKSAPEGVGLPGPSATMFGLAASHQVRFHRHEWSSERNSNYGMYSFTDAWKADARCLAVMRVWQVRPCDSDVTFDQYVSCGVRGEARISFVLWPAGVNACPAIFTSWLGVV
jgi:hypothetical protein